MNFSNYAADLNEIQPDGIMAGNLGAASIIYDCTAIPVFADHSFNLFNHVATQFLQENGIVGATASYEMPYPQVRTLIENSAMPIAITVHGNVEAMISDNNIPAMNLHYNPLENPDLNDKHFALVDTIGVNTPCAWTNSTACISYSHMIYASYRISIN